MKHRYAAGSIIILLTLGGLNADTVRVGLLGGLNYQSYDSGQLNVQPGSGFGLHGGMNVEFFLSPGCLPAQLGLELELLRQNARYNWDTPFQGLYSALVLNNIVIPLMPKIRIGIIPKTDFEFGMGLSLIRNTSGYWRLSSSGDVPISTSDLQTDIGFQLKADVGYKLAPMLLIVPSLRYQINLTANDPDTPNQTEKEHALFIALGLTLGF
jgi:hypothetical protein